MRLQLQWSSTMVLFIGLSYITAALVSFLVKHDLDSDCCTYFMNVKASSNMHFLNVPC